MTRVKRGVISRRKHKKVLASVKGYTGVNKRLIRTAKQAQLHAGAYAFHGRKRKKRDFRRLWVTRISEAVKQEGISYNKFVHGLKVKNIAINRKILSDLLLSDPNAFKQIVDKVKSE